MDVRRRRLSISLLVTALSSTTLSCTDRVAAPDGRVLRPAPPSLDVTTQANPNGPRGRAPTISSLSFPTTTLAIGGVSVAYDVTVSNPGNTRTDVFLQGEIVQGTARRGAGGYSLTCPNVAVGVLPTGDCTMLQLSATASNANGGTGTLVPGSASFVLTLYQTVSANNTKALDSRTVAVTLVNAAPSIASVTFNSATALVVGGSGAPYTVVIDNPGPAQSQILLQGEIHQGTTIVGAGGTYVTCGPSIGVVPTGGCTETTLVATAPGGAGLVPGAATFVLYLYQTVGTTTTLDVETISILLVDYPTITNVAFPQGASFVIGGGNGQVAVTVQNLGSPQSGIVFQGEIQQNGKSVLAGGFVANCAGISDGVLPTGSCTTTGIANAGSGVGTLVAGDATYVVTMYQTLGSSTRALRTASAPITLTGP